MCVYVNCVLLILTDPFAVVLIGIPACAGLTLTFIIIMLTTVAKQKRLDFQQNNSLSSIHKFVKRFFSAHYTVIYLILGGIAFEISISPYQHDDYSLFE